MSSTRHLEDAINKLKILLIMYISMIDINYAVPIEKNCALLLYDGSNLMYMVFNDNTSINIGILSEKKSQYEVLYLTFSSLFCSPVSLYTSSCHNLL